MNTKLYYGVTIMLLLSLFISSTFFGYLISESGLGYRITAKFNSYKTSNESICQDKDLEDTAHCLNHWVNSFYKYNLTDDSINLTLEQLKERGGDCNDWAKLYYSKAIELGFKAKFVDIILNHEGHRYTVMYNEHGYCSLDQIDVHCFPYEFPNSTKPNS